MKLGVSHHTLAENAISLDKPLVFVLDNRKDPEEEEKNKKRKRGEKNKGSGGPTFKNFGSYVQTTKIKGSSKIAIGWRARRMVWKRKWIILGLLLSNMMMQIISHYVPIVYLCIFSKTPKQLLVSCQVNVFNFPIAPGLMRRPMGPKSWSLSGRLGSRLVWWIWTLLSFGWYDEFWSLATWWPAFGFLVFWCQRKNAGWCFQVESLFTQHLPIH